VFDSIDIRNVIIDDIYIRHIEAIF